MTSYENFLNIFHSDLFQLFNDFKNGLRGIGEIILELKNKCEAAYDKGFSDKKLEKNLLFNLNNPTVTIDTNKYLTTDYSTILGDYKGYKNPYKKNKGTSKGSLSNLEKELIQLEFLGLINLGESSTKDPEDHLNLDLKFKSNIFLTEEGVITAKKIVTNRRLTFRQPPSERRNIFIASAFGHSDLDILFSNEFEPSCKHCGYKALRVDINEPSQTITEFIIESIVDAECIIADLSYARPSVYFEVGFALGLGVPIILTCRSDHFKGKDDNYKVHFDLEQFKISYWSINENSQIEWPQKMSIKERLPLILKDKKSSIPYNI